MKLEEQPSEPIDPGDFWLLAQAACDGTLTPPERDRLEGLLWSNAELKKQYVSYLGLHAELQWRFRRTSEPTAADVPQTIASPILDLSPSADSPLPLLSSDSPSSHSGPFNLFRSGVLIWTLVSILLVAWFSWRTWLGNQPQGPLTPDSQIAAHPRPENPVAKNVFPLNPAQNAASQTPIGRVARFESDVIVEREGRKQNVAVGMQILATDTLNVPASGGVELTLADRSQAKLGPRTLLAFSSAREAVLREGFVQIDARNRLADTPLAIVTPDAKAQIRDAWLSMGADRKRTQIRVAEGSVLASRRIDGMEVEIPQGYCSTIARTVDPGPRPSRSGSALVVVSTETMALGEGVKEAKNWERFDQVLADRIVGDRIWRSATPVRVRTYEQLQAEDLEDCAVIVLSVYPVNMGVEQKLKELRLSELPIPIVCLETAGFPMLGLTGETEGTDFGFERGHLVVDIAAPGHPLAAGFVGSGLEIFSHKRRRSYGWGRPAESALTIAHVQGRPNHWMLFAYDQGDAMARGTAPARRVGLFIRPAGADYDSPGFDLVDAAIDWCLDSSSRDSIAKMLKFKNAQISSSSNRLLGTCGLGVIVP